VSPATSAVYQLSYLGQQGEFDVNSTAESIANVRRASENVAEIVALLKFPAFLENEAFHFIDATTEPFEHSLRGWKQVVNGFLRY